jgi:putative intracellular protease/amidase
MTITIELDAKAADVANAAAVISNICNGRASMRQHDKLTGREATGFEDESFAGLSLATMFVNRVNKDFCK